jgi:hypothetical protein
MTTTTTTLLFSSSNNNHSINIHKEVNKLYPLTSKNESRHPPLLQSTPKTPQGKDSKCKHTRRKRKRNGK